MGMKERVNERKEVQGGERLKQGSAAGERARKYMQRFVTFFSLDAGYSPVFPPLHYNICPSAINEQDTKHK